jgi:hypothetical protein
MLVLVDTAQNHFEPKTWARPSVVFKDDLGVCLDTLYVVIDYISINFDHRFNKPS